MTRNYGAPWTAVDIATVRNMVNEGHTNTTIANRLGRTVSSIASLRQSRGIVPISAATAWPFPTVHKEAKPSKSVSHRSLAAPRNGRRWTDSEVNKMRALFRHGKHSIESIAIALERTVSGVLGKLKDEGLLEFDRKEMAYYIPRKLYRAV